VRVCCIAARCTIAGFVSTLGAADVERALTQQAELAATSLEEDERLLQQWERSRLDGQQWDRPPPDERLPALVRYRVLRKRAVAQQLGTASGASEGQVMGVVPIGAALAAVAACAVGVLCLLLRREATRPAGQSSSWRLRHQRAGRSTEPTESQSSANRRCARRR
jgi:hypothetical protein